MSKLTQLEYPEIIERLRPYWEEYCDLERAFLKAVEELEQQMRIELQDERLEFAYAKYGGGVQLFTGIGTCRLSNRGKLFHSSELGEEW